MSGFLVQGRHGVKGNFEMVVPTSHGAGLTHLWRNNDDGSFPWSPPTCFGSGEIASACLVQGNFGTVGNLEVVAREGERLVFYWRMDQSPWTWSGPFTIATRAQGNPALIQSRHGTKGNFEVVAPHVDGGLMHLWRNNDVPSLPWSAASRFGSGNLTGVSLIQGNFGSPGNLELLAVEGDRLVFYWRMDRAPWTWHGPFTIASGVRGVPSLIQGRHGTKGNFEVVVPHRDGGLVHLWRNNDIPTLAWSPPLRFGSGLYDEATVIQGNFGSVGNLEVAARGTDGRLDFYWRMDRSPWTWSGPFLIGAERARNVSECVYGWRSAFFQSDTHVVVRIQLNPDAGISAATMNTLRTTWRNGIIGKWSDRFECRAPNGERRRITFDVHWVTSGAHHVVRVRPGPERSNMTTWDTSDSGDVASHEFGHMLGHPDEYADATCPARSPVNTGTVMDDNTEVVERLMETFANFHCGHDATPVAPPEPAEAGGGVRPAPVSQLRAEEWALFAERMRAAPAAEGTATDARRVVLVVSGGTPGERLEYQVDVTPTGRGAVRLSDQIGERHEAQTDLVLPSDRVRELFERAVSDEVLGDDYVMPALVPDSLVGTLVVTDGQIEKRIRFPVESSTGRTRAPGEADVTLAPASGLLIRQEYVTQGVRSMVEALLALPGLLR
jgi:hypothetical protein